MLNGYPYSQTKTNDLGTYPTGVGETKSETQASKRTPQTIIGGIKGSVKDHQTENSKRITSCTIRYSAIRWIGWVLENAEAWG
jgi:hypothetical protein